MHLLSFCFAAYWSQRVNCLSKAEGRDKYEKQDKNGYLDGEGAKELEENNTITLYEDTNIVKMTVAEENIKAFSIPEEFLTFYYEMSEEEMNFYRTLVE